MTKRLFRVWAGAAALAAALAVSAFGQIYGATGDYAYAPLTFLGTTNEMMPGYNEGSVWQIKVDHFKNNTSSDLRIYVNSYYHSDPFIRPPFTVGAEALVKAGETFDFRATWNGDGPGWPMGVNGWQKITQIDGQAPPSATLTLTIENGGTVTIKQGGTVHGSLTNSGMGSVARSFTLPTGTYTLEASPELPGYQQGLWSGAGLSGNGSTATVALSDNTSVTKIFDVRLTELGFTIQSRTFTYTGGEHPLHIDATLNDGLYTLAASPEPFQSPVDTQTGDKTLSAVNVGTYTATATPVSPYTGPAVAGTLTITKATPTITWNPQPITYGTPLGANQLNATATFVLANGTTHTVPGSFSYNQPTGTILPAGTHTLTGSFTSTDANFKSVAAISATLVVAKATLRVTGSSHSREFKAANPAFSVSYSGFVNSESAGSLTTQPTASTTATAASPIGEYNVTPAGGDSNNYTFDYVAGKLTITRKAVSFTFGNLSNQRTGATFTATVRPTDEEATYSSALSYGPAVGSYTVSATANGNYTGFSSAAAAVTEEAPDVSASISSVIVTGNAPGSATITWSSSNATSVVVGGTGLSSTQASGSQTVTGLSAGDHTYTITAQGKNGPAVQSTTVKISPAQPNVTATISANPTATTAPGTTTITWSSENATAVSVSGPSFTTSTAASGSQTVTGLAVGTYTYTITAQGNGGPVTRSAVVRVDPATMLTATIAVSPAFAYEPASATLTWKSENATSVTVTQEGGATISTDASGNRFLSNVLKGNYRYRITATRGTETVSRTADLVVARPGGTLDATLHAEQYGPDQILVTWTTKNATSARMYWPSSLGLPPATTLNDTVITPRVRVPGSYTFNLDAQNDQGERVTREATVVIRGADVRNISINALPNRFPATGGGTTITATSSHSGQGTLFFYVPDERGQSVLVDTMPVWVSQGTGELTAWTVPANYTGSWRWDSVRFEGSDAYGGVAYTQIQVDRANTIAQTITLEPGSGPVPPGTRIRLQVTGAKTGTVWTGTTSHDSAGTAELIVPSNATPGTKYTVTVYAVAAGDGITNYARSNTAVSEFTVQAPAPVVRLTPIESQLTIDDPASPLHGRTYPRLWNAGGWSAYLGRAGVTFEVEAAGAPAVRTLTLEARSPQTPWTRIGTHLVTDGGSSAVHRFAVTLGEVVPGEPMVPASFRAGSPDTGTWVFRARAEDTGGAWSEYSDELPVTVILPVASRSVSGQTVPPAGPTGDWFTASPVANFSFSLWIP